MLPGLKPYQPNQRMNIPSAASGMLCPGMARAEPSAENLPIREPTMIAPISPAQAPTLCTTVEPAKSRKPLSPSSESQPPPQIQCETMG